MEKKASKNVLLLIMGFLVLIEFVARICIIQTHTLTGIIVLFSLALVALYGFWLYKKPHGNILKYAMLLLALSRVISNSIYLMGNAHDWLTVAVIIVCCGICYCAGRLDRIEQNKILFAIIDIVLLAAAIYCVLTQNQGGIIEGFAFFDSFITFTTLMIAYFVRYREHKEAGLIDAPKK